MAVLSEATIRTYRTNSMEQMRAFPFTVGSGAVLFQGAMVAIELATGDVIEPIASGLVRIGGIIVDGPKNGAASYVAGDTVMVSRGGEVLLDIPDVVATTNPGVPVYPRNDNDAAITKAGAEIGILGHITQVIAADLAWVAIDLSEVNP